MKTAILVGGFMMSAKSALKDLFLEIDSVDSPDPIHEIIILSQPNGLLDLESSLLDNWSPYFSDIAIKRFFNLLGKNQWKRERTAPIFHFDDYSLDASTWYRFPILSSNFKQEIEEL